MPLMPLMPLIPLSSIFSACNNDAQGASIGVPARMPTEDAPRRYRARTVGVGKTLAGTPTLPLSSVLQKKGSTNFVTNFVRPRATYFFDHSSSTVSLICSR